MYSASAVERDTQFCFFEDDETIDLPADVIVYATGMAQNDGSAIAAACEKLGVPCTAIGSAKQLGHGVPAIMDGAVLGREI